MSMIVEDEAVRIPQSRILSRGSFRDQGCLHLLRRLVPFKRPGYEKVVEACSRLAEPRARPHCRKGDAGFLRNQRVLALLACRRGDKTGVDGCPPKPCVTADQKSVSFSIRTLTR